MEWNGVLCRRKGTDSEKIISVIKYTLKSGESGYKPNL